MVSHNVGMPYNTGRLEGPEALLVSSLCVRCCPDQSQRLMRLITTSPQAFTRFLMITRHSS